MQPAGYIVMQHGIRDSRPVKAYQRWMERIPLIYRTAVLDEKPVSRTPTVDQDPLLAGAAQALSQPMPLAMEVRVSPCFFKPADGAIGARHVDAVKNYIKISRMPGALRKVLVSHEWLSLNTNLLKIRILDFKRSFLYPEHPRPFQHRYRPASMRGRFAERIMHPEHRRRIRRHQRRRRLVVLRAALR